MPGLFSRISFRVGFGSCGVQRFYFLPKIVLMYCCRLAAPSLLRHAAPLAGTLFSLPATAVDEFADHSSRRFCSRYALVGWEQPSSTWGCCYAMAERGTQRSAGNDMIAHRPTTNTFKSTVVVTQKVQRVLKSLHRRGL